ncbi:MAG: hypothetical protein IPL73_21250 [Candidatus Obscuribacter sp.]|nr:hypothetical protein [Candidatus Obscuribacter sp.]
MGPALEEVLQALPKIAEQSGKTLVVVFDEFQQIAEYESDTVEKTLRSSIQHHQNIAYVFLGSRKHVIEAMFLDKSRPLYRSAAHYPLGMIDLSAWEIFVSEKFAGTGKNIDRAIIERIYGFTQGHPFYTQHLCHAIWELTTDGSKVTDEIVKAALNLLLDREAFAYTALWESLASNQKTLIEAIASAKNGFKPFSAEFIKNSGLRTPSNIQRAAEALWQRDLIDRDDKGSYYIPDKFFKFWLLKRTPQDLYLKFSRRTLLGTTCHCKSREHTGPNNHFLLPLCGRYMASGTPFDKLRTLHNASCIISTAA